MRPYHLHHQQYGAIGGLLVRLGPAGACLMVDAPLIITVAPNGARKNKEDHAALPMTAAEIATEAKLCLEAGACMLHLHVRDDSGAHTLDVETYRQAMSAVRDQVGDDLIVQITTEALGRYQPDDQIALLKTLHPQAASVALREMTADGLDKATSFYHWAADHDVSVQHILYAPEEIYRLADLAKRSVLARNPLNVLYVLGHYQGIDAKAEDLNGYLAAARQSDLNPTTWTVCAFGRHEGAVMKAAMSGGGHVRVGFENNLLMEDGTTAPNNAALVGQAAEMAASVPRSICNSEQARGLFGFREAKRRSPHAKLANGRERDSANALRFHVASDCSDNSSHTP